MGGSCSNCFSRFSFRRQAGGIEHGFNIPNVYQVEDEEEECAKTPSWLSFLDQEGAEGDNVFVDERCFICLEDYNEQQNLPRILPCGHIVCNKCLIELGRSSVFTKIKCPQDRHSFKIKKRHMPEAQSREISDLESTVSLSVGSGLFLPGVNHAAINPLYNLDFQPGVDIASNINTDAMDSSTSVQQSNSIKSNSSSIMNISIQGNYSISNSSSNFSWRNPKCVMRKRLPDVPRLNGVYDDVPFYEPPPDYPINDEDYE